MNADVWHRIARQIGRDTARHAFQSKPTVKNCITLTEMQLAGIVEAAVEATLQTCAELTKESKQ